MSTAPVVAPVLEAAEAAVPRKRSLLVPIVAGVVVLAVLGAGAWFFVMPRFFGGAAKAPPPPPQVKVTVPLGPVVVNLKGEARRYLRVGVTLGLPGPAEAKAIEEHKSQLLDLVISAFSAAEIETLTTEDGKTALKDTLLQRMRDELQLTKVVRVYFTEFVIQ